jgi:sugar/nucleoside kinase (ribokinase family)
MTDSRLARQTAERLIGSRAQLLKFQCLLGFDGFVDQIFEVVDQRQSTTKYTPFANMKTFGNRVATAGKNASFEIAPQTTRLGGNGPTMAFALSTLGAPVNYVGMLGYPELHPVFTEFAKRTKVYSIAEPGLTQTFDFADSKLTFSQHGSVHEVSWETIKKRLGDVTFQKVWNQSHFIGMLNWTQLPHTSAIWKRLLSDYVTPKTTGTRKLIFFDLCHPGKRLDADLHAALKIIGEFQAHHDVILGLNEAEGQHVAKVLRLKKTPSNPKGMASLAAAIQEKLELHTVVIHPIEYAAGADAQGEVFVNGPYTTKPKISTGAGDHFNAGFVIGRLLGLSLAHSLQLAVAASGFYVRHAISPNREQLVRFLQTL